MAGYSFTAIGHGKELVAHAIHAQSLRNEENVHRAELRCDSQDLIESELFGHRQGRFGSLRGQRRQVSEGDRGTLSSTKVGDMS